MKIFFAISAAFVTASVCASGQTISPSSEGSLGTMPGSATDYTFFGNANQFPLVNYNGAKTQPTVLDDFTIASGANSTSTYQGDNRYSTINGPVGSGETDVQTGILFAGGINPDLVDFTLGKAGSSFNFSNFNAYVMYGNGYGDGNVRDTALTATLLSSTGTVLKTVTIPITDNPAGSSGNAAPVADFELFDIQGATAGDILRLGANGSTTYLGGVSFSEAPEPSTWAMMLVGVAAFVGLASRRARA